MKKDKITLHWETFTGLLPFRMTSDYLFKYLFQSDNELLIALICAFLPLTRKDIRKIQVLNTISIKDDPQKKEMILDILVELNDDTIINLELQVINNHDWPERSVSYLCRSFDSLRSGQGYHRVKSAVHIGFLDYTLFPEYPEFCANYHLRNDLTGHLYTSKFQISVVDLTQIHLATEEDRLHHRDLWSSFFKATTWEVLKMLAQQDADIEKAVSAVQLLALDKKFRQQYEAREDFIRQQIDHDHWYDNEIKKREAIISQMDVTISEKDAAISMMGTAISEKDAAISEKDARIAQLEKMLADKS